MPRASRTPLAALRVIAARADDQSDEVLLGRFAEDRDEESFRAIVRRHGGMVLDVCRSVLRNESDAEDAFQATFLVLATNAGTIRTPAALVGWLHGTAYRTAQKARLSRERRQNHEARAPVPENVVPLDPSWAEVRAAIHEEVNRLPERYRAAIVLFYLTGRTQDEVGTALGLSKDGAKKRLERGRALLRAALDRRGFGAVAVLAATAVSPIAASAALATTTATLVTRYTAGTGPVSAAILALVGHGAKPMLAKTVLGTISLLVVAALVFGAFGIRAEDTPNDRPVPPAKDRGAENAPAPKVASPRFTVRLAKSSRSVRCAFLDNKRILVPAATGDQLEVRDAKTGKVIETVPAKGLLVGDFRVSADRKWVAAVTAPENDTIPRLDFEVAVWEVATWKMRNTAGWSCERLLDLGPDGRTVAVVRKDKIEIRDVAADKLLKTAPFTGTRHDTGAFSPDGAWLAVSGRNDVCYWKWRDGDKYDRLEVGRNVDALLFSPDGKLVAEGPDSRATVEIRDVATLKVAHELSDAAQPRVRQLVGGMAFADAGKTLVYGNRIQLIETIPVPHRIHFWDVKTGKLVRQIAVERGAPRSLAVSPDDKTLAAVIEDADGLALTVWGLDGLGEDAEPKAPPPPPEDVARIEGSERALRAPLAADAGEDAVPFKPTTEKDTFTVRGVVTDENNKPLSGVVVNVVRQAFSKDAPQPRVENFGTLKTGTDGSFAIPSLYPVWERDERSGFVVYFSAPGRAARSLVVGKNFDPKIPTNTTLPTGTDAKVFVPRLHVVVESSKGVVVLEGRDGVEGFARTIGPDRINPKK